jgi:outer membrane receptor for ferrienterochelin and colicins
MITKRHFSTGFLLFALCARVFASGGPSRHALGVTDEASIRFALATGTGSIAGRVTGRGEAEALVGVNILLQGTVRGTTTNGRGEYRIPDVPTGKQTLIFSLVGYQRETRSDILVEEGNETLLDVSLTVSPVQTEQIVVTASKREQSLQDVPVSISIVEAVEIQQRNSLTVDDALRYVPGVNMTGTQVNIRGSSGYSLGAGSRVLMLLDGIPFIPGDTGELNFESIPVGQVDRIEVVKGASSALYGSNALGGVINVITKPIPERAETSFRTYVGLYNKPSYDQWRWSDKTQAFNGQSISFARKVGDLGVSLFASRQIDDGYRLNDYRRRYNFLLKTERNLSSSKSLTLAFGLLNQFGGQFLYWKNLDSALIPPPRHESDNVKSVRWYASGHYNNAVSDHLLLTVKGQWYHNDWGFENPLDIGRTESLSDGFRIEALSTLLLDNVHTLTTGLDGNVDFISGDAFDKRVIGGLALYGQDEMNISAKMRLTLGVRFDFQSVGLSGEHVEPNPKIGISYDVLDGTTLRASFGRGFRVPSLPEAFISAGSTGLAAVPNQDLKPERSSSYELGVSQSLSGLGTIDLAAFRSDFDNLIEPGLIVSGQSVLVQWSNVTRARVQGFETSLRLGFFEGGLAYSLGYTYVYPEDLTQNDLLKYRPRHVFTTNAVARLGWLTAGVDFRAISRVERIDEELVELGIIPDGGERVPIYVTNFRIGADVAFDGFALSATLGMNNAFQHNYVELIGNMMPPRTYVLILEAKL